MIVRRGFVIVAVVVAFCVYCGSNSGVVELSKQEALQLMDLQTKVVMAVADRDQLVRELYLKYGLSLSTHQLNIATGQFTPVQESQDEKSGDPSN